MRRPIAYPITPRGPCVSTALCSITHVLLCSAAPSSWAVQQSSSSLSRRQSRACLPTGGNRRLALSTGASRFGRCRYWCVCCVGPWRSELGVANDLERCRRARLIDFCCRPGSSGTTRRSDDSRKSWRRFKGIRARTRTPASAPCPVRGALAAREYVRAVAHAGPWRASGSGKLHERSSRRRRHPIRAACAYSWR